MVLALLDGRKTQTRRIVTDESLITLHADGSPAKAQPKCRFGQPGDQLWVRETWQAVKPSGIGYVLAEPIAGECEIHYRATADVCTPQLPWRPSIFMPRWASRITLQVTNIRVERLQDISEADAKAEGVIVTPSGITSPSPAKWAYSHLWVVEFSIVPQLP